SLESIELSETVSVLPLDVLASRRSKLLSHFFFLYPIAAKKMEKMKLEFDQ
ncbi:hypothetical protein J6590_011611, partial [Homalodisca vitripennis]